MLIVKKQLFSLIILVCCCNAVWAQISVKGVVTEAGTDEPLPGVNVKVQGIAAGATTDVNGQYALQIPDKQRATLIFSYVGMKNETRTVTTQTQLLNVSLSEDTKLIDEVVVVAYGTRKKGTLAGAVTTVKGEKVATVPAAGFDQALQGQTPGLMVLSNSGEPSKPATFQIRGTNSINSGTAPLFILDGVPISSSDFNTINPADIESINVLKDASSTSIYGARAANGVVVITTKRGTNVGQAQVTFRSQWGFSNLANDNWSLMNTAERICYEKELGLDGGQDYDLLAKTDVNWRNMVFRNAAFLHNYDVSVNKATDKMNYFFSGNFYDQDGIAQSSTFRRYTVRANFEGDMNKWLRMGTNTMFTYEDIMQADDGAYALYTPISACRFMLPYWNPYNADGTLASSNDGSWKGTGVNPIEFMEYNPVAYKKYKMLTSAFMDIKMGKYLTWRTLAGVDFNHTAAFMQSAPSYVVNNGQGTAGRNSSDVLNLTVTNTLTFKKAFGQDHDLTIMVGQEGVNNHSEGFQVVSRGQNNDYLNTVSNGTRVTQWGDSEADYSFLSFFGRGEYNYLQRYYFELALRADASSRFGKDSRWATFGSGGFMWNMLGEQFMQGRAKWLTNARLSLSTGTTGNSSIPNYDHMALVSGGAVYDGTTGIFPAQSGNEKLSWEKVWATNLGLHFGFWRRLNVDIELYNKKTTDMLMLVPVSYADKGEGFRWDNVGAMTNRGVELNVSADIIRTKDWTWSVNGNASYNKNEIDQLYNGLNEYEMSNTSLKLVVGHPVSEFYMVRYAGVNPANGDALWYTKDGRITNVYNENDKVMLGKCYDAPWQGGFGTSLSWKGLTLTAQFSWVANRYMFNNDRFFEESNGLYTAYNQSARLLYDRWKQPGDVTDIPRHGVTPQMDDRFLEDASFLRLKNVMLSYSLPQQLLKRTKFLTSARVYAQAQNLFTITGFSGIDPESSANVYKAQYPMSRQFTFGLDMQF